MPAYTTISNSLVAVGAKPFATTIQALRDNPLAIAEGNATAPRILIGALERLNPGIEIRSRNDAALAVVGEAHRFDFTQAGTVRCTLRQTVSSGTQIVDIRRVRNAVSSDVATWSTGPATVDRSADIAVLPGDTLIFFLESIGGGSSNLSLCRIQTNGENLWPGSSQRLEGNVFL